MSAMFVSRRCQWTHLKTKFRNNYDCGKVCEKITCCFKVDFFVNITDEYDDMYCLDAH